MHIYQNSNLIFLVGISEDYASACKLTVFKNTQTKKKTGNRYEHYQPGGRITCWKSIYTLTSAGCGIFATDFFPFMVSLVNRVEVKGAGWWSAPVQSMLGNCQDYNAPLLAGLATMPRAEWATETELVMTTAWSSQMTRGPPTSLPGHPGMTAWMRRCSDSSQKLANGKFQLPHNQSLIQ